MSREPRNAHQIEAPAPRVTAHDPYHLEIKLAHALEGRGHHSTQVFEVWVYLPHTLGMASAGIDQGRFYEDLTSYVRFRTPRMSLPYLLSADSPNSPLHWLQRHEKRLTSGVASPAEVAMAIREVRLTAAIFRSAVRDEAQFLVEHSRASGLSPLAEHLAAADRFLDETTETLRHFRGLKAHFHESRTPAGLREALDVIDDFMSVQVLEAWFVLLEVVQCNDASAALADRLRDAITTERDRRIRAGQLTPEPDNEPRNELFVYRANMFRKIVLGVLHLQLVRGRRRERVQDILFAVASAVAMAVAVVLQLLTLWTVGIPQAPTASGALVLFLAAAVGGYILKDRLKDRLKTWFQARIPQWLHDREQELRAEDGSRRRIGSVAETVRLLRPSEVPAAVARIREYATEPLFALLRANEDVLHYRRVMKIDTRAARELGPEMSGLNEILRLGVRPWLRRMDQPVRTFLRIDDDGLPVRMKAPRTYRVNLVLSVRSGDQLRYERVAVVLTRKGIKRIEPIGEDGAPTR